MDILAMQDAADIEEEEEEDNDDDDDDEKIEDTGVRTFMCTSEVHAPCVYARTKTKA